MSRFTVANFLRDYPISCTRRHVRSIERWLDHEDTALDRMHVFEILEESFSQLGGLPPVVEDFYDELCRTFKQ